MAVLAHNLSHSVAVVRRKLLQMMDALAESGMRQAHRKIIRARALAPGRSVKRRRRNARKRASAPVH